MTHIKEDPLLSEDEEYWENIDVNDCNYLLRTLEREAYSSVISALRAKGPPSEHTFLLLDHLKSALSISDELGRAEIRKAAVDPRLCKLAKTLNPNYDTCTEWSTCSIECRSLLGTKSSRPKPFANTCSSSIADQLLNQAIARNDNVNRSSARAFELLSLPHRPFVPERLRLLLRETDRPEERIAYPFEPLLTSPVPVPVPAEKSISEDRPPPAKKRKQRTSKGPKIRETPPELLPQKTLKLDEDEISKVSKALLEAVSTLEAAAAAKAPKTPVAATAATAATTVVAATPSTAVGSGGSGIMSPNEPPQSGDAMKTWVSKIHEQEMAASVAKRNGGTITISPVEMCAPSTSSASAPSTEDSEKKKKRRSKPVIDPYYLNTSARTRPFQFDKGEGSLNGNTKSPKANPDKRNHGSPIIHSYHTPHSASGSISNIGLTTPSTPIARPDVYHAHGHLNGRLEESPAVHTTMPSILKAAAAVGSPNRAAMKRPHPIVNSIRVPPKYIVTNSGVATPPSSISLRTPTSTGLAGRTASLGSQQMISLHGMHFTSQKTPSTSNSNYSVHSIGGGSTASGIGGSSSSILPESSKGVSAIPPEEAGHDYGHPPPPPAHVVALAAAARARMAAGADDGGGAARDTTALRLTPRVAPRPRIVTPVMRSPSSMSTHSSPQSYGASNGLSSSPSSVPSLQRAANQSGMQPRLGSRGAAAVAAAAAGGGVTGGERGSVTTDAVTEGEIQAKVHNIMLEAAQKECANGKRTTMPIDLLRERDNGIANHQSYGGPSVKSVLSTHYSVCRPSTSSEGATTSSSSVQSPTCRQGVDSSLAKTPILASLTAPSSSTPSSFSPFSSQPSSSYVASPSTSSSFFPSLPSSNLISNPSPVSSLTLNDDLMRDLLLLATGPLQQQQQSSPAAAAPPSIPPPVPPSAPSTTSSRPQQRQYVLQPEGMSYAEYRPDNPRSFKSFTSDGVPLQYSVSPEELYDQGILARPSTSGGGGMGNGMNGSNGATTLQNSSLASFSFPQQSTQIAAAAAAQLGVPSSFTIQSNMPRANDNGETPSMNRDDLSYLQSSQLHRPSMTSSALLHPSSNSSSEVKDILEQSCLELR